jgi:hypothetical protein
MKLALLPLSVAALAVSFSLLTGCAAPTDEGSAPPPSGAATGTVSTEDEVRSSDLAGTYKANTDDDSYDFGDTVKVTRSGTKLTVDLDGEKYALGRTRSGAYVFSSGEINGECDNPGCSYLSKVSGVVYLKKVGTKKVASIKLSVTRNHIAPEYVGDLEGELTDTLRFTKGR